LADWQPASSVVITVAANAHAILCRFIFIYSSLFLKNPDVQPIVYPVSFLLADSFFAVRLFTDKSLLQRKYSLRLKQTGSEFT
jgi:hypothetical protein